MSKYIIMSFDNQDGPITGLTPSLRGRRVDNGSIILNGVSMEEIGDGFYRYLWTGYDPNILCVFFADGGEPLGMDRYSKAWQLQDLEDDLKNVSDNVQTLVDIEGGDWTTSPPNVLVFSKKGGGAEIMRFLAYDSEGNPSLDPIATLQRVV